MVAKKTLFVRIFFVIIFKEQQVLLYVTKNAEYLGLIRISSTVLFKASWLIIFVYQLNQFGIEYCVERYYPQQNIYYRPQRSCGKVIFSQASVILSIGGCIPACTVADTPLPGQTPHLPSACWDTHPHPVHAGIHIPPLPAQCMPGYAPPRRPLLRTSRILLECILVVLNSRLPFTYNYLWSARNIVCINLFLILGHCHIYLFL